MPRTPISNTFTEITPPSTSWETDRGLKYLIQESLWKLLLESWDWALLLERSINTIFETPRYSNYLEDLTWLNMQDLTWADLLTLTWTEVNKLDTLWN